MKIVSPCLIKGLKSHDSPSIIKSSIFCLSDIIRGLENEFNYIDEYLPLILDILSDNTIEESLKPTCFLIISDIFVYCQNDAFKYFDENESGKINLEQIKHGLMTLGEPLSEEEFKILEEELDFDEDGNINYAELANKIYGKKYR